MRRATCLTAVLLVALIGAGRPAVGAAGDAPERLFSITSSRIDESSGLAAGAALPGVLWTVNDSGGTAQVFGLGPDGRTVATLTLRGATNRDWEAVATGPRTGGGSWLWVGDIGDNLATWPSVRVYRVREPGTADDRSMPWTAYDLVYPDGPRDAEALLVDPSDGRLYVVSKRVQGAAVYRAPRTLSPDRANRLTKVSAAPALVTDGAFAPDGRVALRDYLQAYVSTSVEGPRQRIALPLLPQGESLTWTRDGAALLAGSEGEHSAVWRVPVPRPVVDPTQSPGTPTPLARDPAGPVAAEPAEPRRSPWLVVVAGLLVGAGLGFVVRAVSRCRHRPQG